eukprot:TRINITY_DN33778_c0_g1_i1.p1 TRINITY_DN33778_c0_g1~~TRINITY_DN33778_c0_g1_i1.p1  ORF type:complete len:640 (-),score=132.26 TRINITY_DN33778_c0_g1_i1:230-2149(-)
MVLRALRPSSATRQRSSVGNAHTPMSAREKDGGHCSTFAAGGKVRPRTAELRRKGSPPKSPASPTLSRARQAALADEFARYLESLKVQCIDLKSAANQATKDTQKTRTRLMALERELQKRERMLVSMLKLRQAGLGLGVELFEKLREERNMLPLYRRKILTLQSEMEERNADLRKLKRDPNFTRVIELQVEYTSWQHETRRLESMLQEIGAGEPSTAQRELEAHRKQAESLEATLKAYEKRLATMEDELADVEEDHNAVVDLHATRQEELMREQVITKDLALSLKELLQERRHAEKLEEEVEELVLRRRRHLQELEALAEGKKQTSELREARSRMNPSSDACFISKEAFSDEVHVTSMRTRELRSAAFAAVARRDATLSAELQAADEDADGILSRIELIDALNSWTSCPLPPDEASTLLTSLHPSLQANFAVDNIRWLDLVTLLDRIGRCPSVSSSSPSSPKKVVPLLPDLRPVRAASLRANLSAEDFQTQLTTAGSEGSQEAFWRQLGLAEGIVAELVKASEAAGGISLFLLLFPITEASQKAPSLSAWKARCADAVRAHKQELVEAFSVWRNDMMLTEDQFRMVCMDIMGAKLTQDDIDDLALLAGAGDKVASALSVVVNGGKVLQLANHFSFPSGS